MTTVPGTENEESEQTGLAPKSSIGCPAGTPNDVLVIATVGPSSLQHSFMSVFRLYTPSGSTPITALTLLLSCQHTPWHRGQQLSSTA
jgi:hypothetical protein